MERQAVRSNHNTMVSDCEQRGRDLSTAGRGGVFSLRKELQDFSAGQASFSHVNFCRKLPAILENERESFRVLWRFLNDLGEGKNRLQVMSSLQLFIAQMRQPLIAIEILLQDFLSTESIRYSDRNCLMLLSILLRAYNKELSKPIEQTPSAVLMVRHGLKPEMVQRVSTLVETNFQQLQSKVDTLSQAVIAEVGNQAEKKGAFPLPYLISLLRELCIFCALVGCPSSHRIIRHVVGEFCNPFSDFYGVAMKKGHFQSLLTIVHLGVKTLYRFRNSEDLNLFREIMLQQKHFAGQTQDMVRSENAQVVQVVEMIGEYIRSLTTVRSGTAMDD